MKILRFSVKRGRSPKDLRPIVTLSNHKATRVINLYKRYVEIGFKGFDLIDIAEMSLKQWSRRDYPIPKGYRLDWTKILVKKKITDLIRS